MRAFPGVLAEGILLRRYRRFLADVRLAGGRKVTVHCPNPGAMTGLATPGAEVRVAYRPGPGRKLAWTWELVRVGRSWVCVDTAVANRVVGAWLAAGRLLPGTGTVRREVARGGSRLDFLLGGRCLVEVKSVTLAHGRVAAFPDAVTARGRRHLDVLARARGFRRVLLYFVARGDVATVRPADEIDPAYGRALRAAARAGVEILAVRASFSGGGEVRQGPLLDVLL